jgi:pseudomonalisin
MKSKATTVLAALFLAGLGSSQVCAQVSPARPRVRQAVDNTRRVVLKGRTHPLAQPEFDRGPAPDRLAMDRILLVLRRSPEQAEELAALLEEQHDPASPNFQQWLTPEEYGRRFGPAEEDVHAVASWLMSQGFQVDDISRSRMAIEFSGTAATVQRAFHTRIRQFAVNGAEHWANPTDPEIPQALEPVIEGFASLHNFHSRPQVVLAGAAVRAEELSSPLTNMGNGQHWLSPADYATIYNIKPLYAAGINGAGATIAVVGRSNIDVQDVADFRKIFGLPANPPQVIVNGPDPGQVKGVELSEAVLDVTWAGAVAPNATVKFVVSKSTATTDGIYLSAKYIVDHNLADVMTVSFGACEAAHTSDKAMITALAQQAAAQGITFVVSAGDSGSAGCDAPASAKATKGLGVNYLASTPYNVAVGGTQFNDAANPSKYWAGQNGANLGSALSYIPEKVWNESCEKSQTGCATPNLWAGSGGASIWHGKPSWQAGVPGIPNDGKRNLPDVSLTAAVHDPYIICMSGGCRASTPTFNLSGGTSAGAPAFAGMMALVKQKTGARQGQANTVLYALASKQVYTQCNGSAGTPASTCVFQDVTVGHNAVPGVSGYGAAGATYTAGTGYDLATGLGSVNAYNLVSQWTSAKYAPTTTSLTVSPSGISAGGSATVSVIVSPRSGSGKPSGTVAVTASTGRKLADLKLSGGAAIATVSDWPGGTYTVTAAYAGDGTYSPSSSAAVGVTVAEPKPSQPVINSVSPSQVRAEQQATLVVNGSGFQPGLAAYVWVGGEYYEMTPASVASTQVKFGVIMGGPGPYTAWVLIMNPDGLHAFGRFEVVN